MQPSCCFHKGCRLSYEIRGTGPPAIFIQGVGVHGCAWKPQIDSLSARYECLSFDNRGLGQSQPLGCQLTLQQMSEDVIALLDARGWESAHVIGHSMGGLIAIETALAARNRVRSLSLLCTFPRGRDATRITPEMFWFGLRTRIGTKPQRRRAFLKIVMSPSALAGCDHAQMAAELAPVFGHDLAVQPGIAIRQLSAMARYDARPRLGELAGLPTLVVSATHDRLARVETGRRMAAAIPGARFLEISDAAHGATIQHAARVNELLFEHLAKA
jgi:pimeloyl-ACP methyl ester carboxylesterase